MLRNIFTFIFMVSSLGALSQGDTTWLNAKWKPTDKEGASFYRTKSIPSGKHFIITDYYLDGKVQMQGLSMYPDSSHWDGTVTWFYPGGTIKQTAVYSNNNLIDTVFSYFMNGFVESIRLYENGNLKGTAKQFDSTGHLQFEMDFKSGALKVYRRYRNNKLILSQEFKTNNVQHGQSLQYSEDGILLAKEMYFENARHGIAESYYTNGKLRERIPYVNGEANGIVEEFYESGLLKSQQHYVNGALQGKKERYSAKGKLAERVTYKDGKRNGTFISFGDKPNAEIACYYINDLLDSTCNINDRNEKLAIQATFKAGILHGPLNIYENKRLKIDAQFKNGSIVSFQSFHPNGKLFRTATMNADSLVENWVTYDVKGNKILETEYRFGSRHGIWKKYKGDQLVFQLQHRTTLLDDDIRYRKNRIESDKKEEIKKLLDDEEEAEKEAQNIIITDAEIENITGSFSELKDLTRNLPPRFFTAEDSLLNTIGLYDSDGYGIATWMYFDSSIQLIRNFDEYRSVPSASFRITPSDIDELKTRFEFKEIRSPDGLSLLVESEKGKPDKNEIQIYVEHPSEATLKVMRFAFSNATKNTLKKDVNAVASICDYLYKKYKNEYTLADISFALCNKLFEEK